MALTLLPPKGQGQVMAAGLLFVVLGLVYYFGLHWFVSGHRQVSAEMADTQQSELRFRQETTKRKSLDVRLQEVEDFKAKNTYFLPDATFDLGAATLSSKLKDVMAAHTDAARCSNISTQPQKLGTKELYERVSIQVRLRCDLDDLVKIMYALENSTPLLFIDELNLYQQPVLDASLVTSNGGNMDARFDLSGYIRPPAQGAAAQAPPSALIKRDPFGAGGVRGDR
jgi:general secretion pathway protein M